MYFVYLMKEKDSPLIYYNILLVNLLNKRWQMCARIKIAQFCQFVYATDYIDCW